MIIYTLHRGLLMYAPGLFSFICCPILYMLFCLECQVMGIGSVIDTFHVYFLCSLFWQITVIGKRQFLSMYGITALIPMNIAQDIRFMTPHNQPHGQFELF